MKNVLYTPYERKILNSRGSSPDFRSVLAGVSRVCRLSRYYPDTHKQVIWNTASNIIGPAFFFFVWWTLEQAQEQGIKRLYFLARDGQILFDIAQIIKKDHFSGIDCRYLYGSRQAWFAPSVMTMDSTELKWVLSDWWYDISVDSVGKRLLFKPEDIRHLLVENGLEVSPSQILSVKEKTLLKQCLRSKGFCEWFTLHKSKSYENMVGYLKQEGIFDQENYGLVDIGWRGNQQFTLTKILRNSQLPKSIKGFYLGLTESVHKTDSDSLHGFLFDLSRSTKRMAIRNNHIYETFASSVDPRVINYRCEGGKFYPMMLERPHQKVIDWGIMLQREGVLNFAKEIMRHCPLGSFVPENYYPVLENILFKFINTPSLDEAEVYGSFPMDGEMTESQVQEIAPVTTRKAFWKAILKVKKFRFFWIQAVFLRSSLKLEYYMWKMIMPVVALGMYLGLKLLKKIGISPI